MSKFEPGDLLSFPSALAVDGSHDFFLVLDDQPHPEHTDARVCKTIKLGEVSKITEFAYRNASNFVRNWEGRVYRDGQEITLRRNKRTLK